MSIGPTILLAVAVWLLLEAGLLLLHRRLQRDFQWLIGPADETPSFPPDLIEKYLRTSFDRDLGWVRRAKTIGEDRLLRKRTTFAIDATGCRFNPGHDGAPSRVAAFGDSYTFCRLVDDHETWPHYLSDKLATNVRNFGVGNYGLDQALLRVEKELPNLEADTIVIGVVPETIARVQSYWKHYFEYGNILAFKPRFTLDGDDLRLHRSAVQSPGDFATVAARLDAVRALDPFYVRKFRDDLLRFPRCWHLLRRWRRHGPVIVTLLRGLGRGDMQSASRLAFDVVMAENARWTHRLYRDPEATALLRALIGRFAETCRQAGKHPVLVIMPQPMDRPYLDDGREAYRAFFAEQAETLPVVDMTTDFLADPEPASLYVEGALGPHVSAKGNRLIAERLAEQIRPLLQDSPSLPDARSGSS